MEYEKSSDFIQTLNNFNINVQEENAKIKMEESNPKPKKKNEFLHNSYSYRKKTKNIIIFARDTFEKNTEEISPIKSHSNTQSTTQSIEKDLFTRFDEFQRKQRNELKEFKKCQKYLRKISEKNPLFSSELRNNYFNSPSKKYLFIKNENNKYNYINKNEKEKYIIKYNFLKYYFQNNIKEEKNKSEYPLLFGNELKNKISSSQENKINKSNKYTETIINHNKKSKGDLKNFIAKSVDNHKKYLNRIAL